jgi:hypothetical protein
MADNEDGEIGRCIIGAMMIEIELTVGANMIGFKVFSEQVAFATFRTFLREAALEREPKRAVLFYR